MRIRLVLAVVVFTLTYTLLLFVNRTSPPPVQVEPGHDVLLLGVTSEGTRIYKVSGPKLVVPVIFVQSTNGNVAMR